MLQKLDLFMLTHGIFKENLEIYFCLEDIKKLELRNTFCIAGTQTNQNESVKSMAVRGESK